ncbi:MAG: Ig-like domain-containing protein, partial [Methanosphaera sp.]|nr:Ig-like domain-containing protein [Methanosphaera sp.]
MILVSLSAVTAYDNDTVIEDGSQELSTHSTGDAIITQEKTQTDTNTATDNSENLGTVSKDMENPSKNITKDANTTNLKSQTQHRTKISVSDRKGYITTNVQLIATVADKETNTYANGGLVVFKLNGISIGSSTLKSGKAYYTYNTKNLSAGYYLISATYGGEGKYAPSKTIDEGILELLPLPIKIATVNITANQTKVVLKATV